MENAGRGCADVLCRLGIAGPIVICCGGGNNGGDGFVLARHLDLRGHAVRLVLCSDPGQLRGDAAHNFHIVEKAGIPQTILPTDVSPAELADCLGRRRLARGCSCWVPERVAFPGRLWTG